MLRRRVEQFPAGHGHQILVGCHHMLSRMQGRQDTGPGRFQSAHQLDHDLDGIILHNFMPVCCQKTGIVHLIGDFRRIFDSDPAQFQLHAQFLAHLRLLGFQYFIGAHPHCAEP